MKFSHIKEPYWTLEEDGTYKVYYEKDDYVTEDNPKLGRLVGGIPPCDYPLDTPKGPVMATPIMPCGKQDIIYNTHVVICKERFGWAINDNFFEENGDRTLHQIFIAPFRKNEGSTSKGRYLSLETGEERQDLMMCEDTKLALELAVARELISIKTSFDSISEYLSILQNDKPELFI